MCGIIGYTGGRDVQPLLLGGLAALEYRGYDSAGVALQSGGALRSVRSVGNLAALRAAVATPAGAVAVAERPAHTGIGHTRWATHGRVSRANAHPHADMRGRVHVVVNGIVENHASLREDLEAGGAHFSSETDAEVIAQLLGALYDGDLAASARAAYPQLEGQFAFVAVAADEPDVLVGVRREAPLVLGLGDGEVFVASAVSAFAEHTQHVLYPHDGDVCTLRPDAVAITDVDRTPVTRPVEEIDAELESASHDGYGSFMAKEIAEQSAAVARTLDGRLREDGAVRLEAFTREQLAAVRSVRIVACGTSYHAGLVARYAIERWARVPVDVEVASEFRYRDPVPRPGGLVIAISQSGETADTLAAMRLARAAGETVVAVTNVEASQAARDADGVLLTRAGTEIGVAATKTFSAQLTALYLLGLALADAHGTLEPETRARLARDLRAMPAHLDVTVQRCGALARELGARFADAELFMFLGRDVSSAVAQEGALKLKEITYRPADAHPAGEMKHGPIALIAPGTPVLVDATTMPLREKLASNLAEVGARGAHVIAVVADGDELAADDVFRVPRVDWLLAPLLSVVAWQLVALELAVARGLNVDQPRNLAKTVTVE